MDETDIKDTRSRSSGGDEAGGSDVCEMPSHEQRQSSTGDDMGEFETRGHGESRARTIHRVEPT